MPLPTDDLMIHHAHKQPNPLSLQLQLELLLHPHSPLPTPYSLIFTPIYLSIYLPLVPIILILLAAPRRCAAAPLLHRAGANGARPAIPGLGEAVPEILLALVDRHRPVWSG